jgi:hypothetical protein
MSCIASSFEAFGHQVSHMWESCSGVVVSSAKQISIEYEAGKEKIVGLAREHLPESAAYVVERITSAVPEVFVALSSLWAGFLTIPALLVSWGRKIEPMLPMLKPFLKGDLTVDGLGKGLRLTLDGFDRMFERVVVPSLLVAFAVDTVFSFAIGWLAQDWGTMLHASAIAFPGFFLTLRYMLNQKAQEEVAPLVTGLRVSV